MSQTTEIQIQNQNGLSFRTKLNQMLSALNTVFAGTTAPTVTEAGMLWMDTSVSPNVLKRRDSADTAWEVVPLVESATLAAASKATPVDDDLLPLVDSASSNILKKLTWANAKSTLKSYLDGFYVKLSGGNLTGPINECTGNVLASASTVDLNTATGNFVIITGTTTINSFGTAAQNGTRRVIWFTGTLTLTHLSGGGIPGVLYLPTKANITTQADDVVTFVKNSNGIWMVTSYVRADGTALVSTTTSATTSNSQEFTASGTFNVPAGVTAVYLTGIGGGGGGGGVVTPSAAAASCAGAPGAVAIRKKVSVTPGAAITVTIGGGGAGSTTTGGGGGATSFGALLSLSGGVGGNGGNSTGIAASLSSGVIAATGTTTGGSSLPTQFGNGANGGVNAVGGSAPASSGAGGAGTASASASRSGGTGGSGYLLVEW